MFYYFHWRFTFCDSATASYDNILLHQVINSVINMIITELKSGHWQSLWKSNPNCQQQPTTILTRCGCLPLVDEQNCVIRAVFDAITIIGSAGYLRSRCYYERGRFMSVFCRAQKTFAQRWFKALLHHRAMDSVFGQNRHHKPPGLWPLVPSPMSNLSDSHLGA